MIRDKSVVDELQSIISIPTVLMRKDGVPPEYKGSQKYRKMKVRCIDHVSVRLMSYLLSKGADLASIQKFSSGDFDSYLSMSNAYVK